MPFFNIGNAEIYYEDHGSGEPIIALHGLSQNIGYFTRTGVVDALVAGGYRVISMDMRAHGKSRVQRAPKGYDEETASQDMDRLADYLGIDRFHILSHSTGGFVASRYAMKTSERLFSLILTGTASVTSFFPVKTEAGVFYDRFAASFENNSWEKILEDVRNHPYPLFRGISENPDSETLFQKVYEIMRTGDRTEIAEFVRSFYTDPDPRIEGLRKIGCPTLILVGEKDDLFLESSRLMQREISGARMVIIPDTGHMLAIEAPERMNREIIAFLDDVTVEH